MAAMRLVQDWETDELQVQETAHRSELFQLGAHLVSLSNMNRRGMLEANRDDLVDYVTGRLYALGSQLQRRGTAS